MSSEYNFAEQTMELLTFYEELDASGRVISKRTSRLDIANALSSRGPIDR